MRYLTAGALPRPGPDQVRPDNEERALTVTSVTGEDPFRRFFVVREGELNPHALSGTGT